MNCTSSVGNNFHILIQKEKGYINYIFFSNIYIMSLMKYLTYETRGIFDIRDFSSKRT